MNYCTNFNGMKYALAHRVSMYRAEVLWWLRSRRSWLFVDKLRFSRQSIEPRKRSVHQVTPTVVAFVANAVLLANGLDCGLDEVQVAVIEAWEKMMFYLQVESVGQHVPQSAVGTKIVGRFDLMNRPRVLQCGIAQGVAFRELIGIERCLVQVIDLRKDGKYEARSCNVRKDSDGS